MLELSYGEGFSWGVSTYSRTTSDEFSMAVRPFSFKVMDRVNKGWRVESKKLGTRWDVIRLRPATGYTTVGTNKLFRVNHYIDAKVIEFAAGSFVYRARGDRKLLQLGDLLVGKETTQIETEPTTVERYTVVQLRILRENLIVRTDDACTLYRPTQRTSAGVQATSTYNFESTRNAKIAALDLGSGLWNFFDQGSVPVGAPTTIYAGFTLGGDGKFGHRKDLPLGVPDTGWIATTGLLNAPFLLEGDLVAPIDPVGALGANELFRIDRPYPEFEGAFIQQNWCTKVRH